MPVVAPVLHSKVPEYPVAVKLEVPQLFITETPGAAGIVLGAELPFPAGLVHPLAVVCVMV